VRRRGQDREHRPVPEKITSLADRVLDGEIRLPKFQREFVWSKQQVLDLLDSIARGYPIGSFLLWNSDSPTLASDQSIAGLQVPSVEEGDDTAYLLDGCQRLSTICGALHWIPDGDADSYWNLVYDLEDERFKHRDNHEEPPEREVPLRLLSDLSELVDHIARLPQPLRDRAKALYARFDKYEVSVVTLHGTSLSERVRRTELRRHRGDRSAARGGRHGGAALPRSRDRDRDGVGPSALKLPGKLETPETSTSHRTRSRYPRLPLQRP
jgi:uncharacterized protein DUF262